MRAKVLWERQRMCAIRADKARRNLCIEVWSIWYLHIGRWNGPSSAGKQQEAQGYNQNEEQTEAQKDHLSIICQTAYPFQRSTENIGNL